MKKKIIYITVVLVGCIAIVFTLNLIENTNDLKSSFYREIKDVSPRFVKSIQFSDNTVRFSSKQGNKILLNQFSDDSSLFEIDFNLKNLKKVRINFPSGYNKKAYNIYKDVFATHIICTNLYGNILVSNDNNSSLYNFNDFSFDSFQAISSNEIIIRGKYPRNKQNNLHNRQDNLSIAKLVLSNKVKLLREYKLPDLENGIFTNDGMLSYDKINSIILYMYYYQGEILALDTNLNLLYKFKTIDRTKSSIIETKKIYDSKNRTQLIVHKKPPKIVHSFITFDGQKIYIRSKLKAKNESSSVTDNQIVDIYNINGGQYLSSFYIPNFQGKKAIEFQIKDDMLFAIHGNYLVKYSLRL